MVLIWPDKLPRISSDGEDVTNDTANSSSSSAAIVGSALHDGDVIVVIGAVISTSDSSQQSKKDVTSAISKCTVTTTLPHQSADLSVIATLHENSNGPDGTYTIINEQNFQKHNDIFIYNPKEAEVWNTQYNQFQRRQSNNECGALQRSLVYVSKSNSMFQELASVLRNGSSNRNEKQGNLTVQLQQQLNTLPTKQHNTSFSLLLLHWNSVTDDNPLYQIPVLRALKSIWKERRCSISSITLIIEFAFGLLLGLYVLQYPEKIIQNVCDIKEYHDQLFDDNLNWLQAFPVGFKLNVALTYQIGKEVRRILFYHKRICSFIAATTAAIFGEGAISVEQIATNFLQTMGILTTFLGSRFFFAMVFDATRLALLQIHFLSEIFAQCLRYEMSALKSFWLLFNGKKRNILRKRSDNLHYDHMQLLLGMVLFSTCLFVFTTVLVYHWFFAVTNFGATMICSISWSLFMGVEGGVQCEKVILRRRMKSRDNCSWKGDEVQFAPVTLSESINRLDTSYVTCIYNSTESTELQSSRDLLPNVTIESEETCAMKIIFPSESDISIIFAALVSFVVSLTSRVPTLVNRLLFGSRCQSGAASLIDFANALISGQG
jgi:hypothetical protein